MITSSDYVTNVVDILWWSIFVLTTKIYQNVDNCACGEIGERSIIAGLSSEWETYSYRAVTLIIEHRI